LDPLSALTAADVRHNRKLNARAEQLFKLVVYVVSGVASTDHPTGAGRRLLDIFDCRLVVLTNSGAQIRKGYCGGDDLSLRDSPNGADGACATDNPLTGVEARTEASGLPSLVLGVDWSCPG